MSTTLESETTVTTNGKARKGPPEKTEYPKPEGGFSSIPADFDSSKHKMLARTDFTDECIWLDWQADRFEAKAKEFRDEAVMLRSYGNEEQRKQAVKVQKLTNSLQDLLASMAAQGMDISKFGDVLAKIK